VGSIQNSQSIGEKARRRGRNDLGEVGWREVGNELL
jgi:hypothetical protein